MYIKSIIFRRKIAISKNRCKNKKNEAIIHLRFILRINAGKSEHTKKTPIKGIFIKLKFQPITLFVHAICCRPADKYRNYCRQ